MPLTRRQLLGGAGGTLAAAALAACSRSGSASTGREPSTTGVTPQNGAASVTTKPIISTHRYGADAAQYGELYLPAPGVARQSGTIVVIHGGFWRSIYTSSLGRPLAADLAARGWAAWNLEYRRVGDGGGWTGTFDDVAAGIDALAEISATAGTDLDLSRVVAIGHSAGGHLATWAASRSRLPVDAPGAAPKVAVTAVVSQAGVVALTDAADQNVGSGAVLDLIGGTPRQEPERYAWADPARLLPIGAPVLCVHSHDDESVPYSQSEAYVQAATAAKDRATLLTVPGTHLDLIDPTSSAWHSVIAALPSLLR